MTFNDEGLEGTYDVAEITFKDAELTLIVYGGNDDGSDLEIAAAYTVADGKATMTHEGESVTTSAIENDTFTATLSPEDDPVSFSTTKGSKLPTTTPSDPDTPSNPDTPTDPDTPAVNPFTGKTFYGSQTIEDAKYDVCELKFTSETDVTLVLYGQGADGADKTEPLKYTVSDGKASVTYNGNKITTTAIVDNTFTASLDGTDATKCSFSTTKGTKLPLTTPSDPDTPTDPDTPPVEETILDNAGIAGIDGWSGSPLTKVDSTTYTYEFTAKSGTVEFAVQKIKGSWDDGKWCAATISAKDASAENVNASSEKVDLVYNGGSTNAKITNLGVNSTYLLTITIDDAATNAISATVTLKEYAAPPTVYSLEGLSFKGAWTETWDDVKTLTAETTQTYEITATNDGKVCNEFGIFGSSGNLWEGKSVPFGVETELTYKAEKGENSTMASDFEIGKTYIVVLKVTDDSITAPKLTITVTAKPAEESF